MSRYYFRFNDKFSNRKYFIYGILYLSFKEYDLCFGNENIWKENCSVKGEKRRSKIVFQRVLASFNYRLNISKDVTTRDMIFAN